MRELLVASPGPANGECWYDSSRCQAHALALLTVSAISSELQVACPGTANGECHYE